MNEEKSNNLNPKSNYTNLPFHINKFHIKSSYKSYHSHITDGIFFLVGVSFLTHLMVISRRQEMDSLQKQMEEHTVTVTSLASAEEELQKLRLHDNSSNDLPNGE